MPLFNAADYYIVSAYHMLFYLFFSPYLTGFHLLAVVSRTAVDTDVHQAPCDGQFYVNLTEARVVLKERTSVEKMPLPEWPLGKLMVHIFTND